VSATHMTDVIAIVRTRAIAAGLAPRLDR
jgi:hypothetical protein